MSELYPIGRAEDMAIGNQPWFSAPSAIEGHPVIAAFLQEGDHGWIIVFHEEGTPADPYDDANPYGFVVASITRNKLFSMHLRVLISGETYPSAMQEAIEASRITEGVDR